MDSGARMSIDGMYRWLLWRRGTWWCQATEHVEGCFATDPSAAERRRVYASRRTTSLNEITIAAMRIAPDAFLPLNLRYAIAERALQLVEAWVAEGEEDQ